MSGRRATTTSGSGNSSGNSSAQYHMTFHGLERWYRCVFEQFGWVLLDARDDRKNVVDAYSMDVENLVKAIEEKAAGAHDADRKDDLAVLLFNLKTLRKKIQTACECPSSTSPTTQNAIAPLPSTQQAAPAPALAPAPAPSSSSLPPPPPPLSASASTSRAASRRSQSRRSK